MRVLAIETSCDETSAAIVTSDRQILSNVVVSQIDEHTPFGGVVPEIASRAHIRYIDSVIKESLNKAKCSIQDIDAVAVTSGPGLIGGVIVGLMAAKGIAAATNKPLIAVNHLEGHALTVRLTDDVPFPFLLLLVSGGHCQILIVHGVGNYTRLGTTLDDALGEAFDKTAKMLGLGYPGGPQVEKRAKNGDPNRFPLPLPLCNKVNCDFSFSGLKTAVLHTIESCRTAPGVDPKLTSQDINDICASFQQTCAKVLNNRLTHAISSFKEQAPTGTNLVIAGGVAANKYLRKTIDELGKEHGLDVIAPPLNLCTDNAAMIAWAGIERLIAGEVSPLDCTARARWPLTDMTPPDSG